LIRNYFNPTNAPPTGANLQQELRLTDPDVLCSALKWCWSRLPGGVVTWEVYELFRQASHSFSSPALYARANILVQGEVGKNELKCAVRRWASPNDRFKL
jgi:hypothetical protein